MAARKRTLAVFAAGALVAPLSFASPAFANHIEVRSIETACPTNQLPADPFTDVDEDDPFEDEITCLAEYEITSGTGDGSTYSPAMNVTRQQMAVFIANLLEQAGLELDTADAGFTDLDLVNNQGIEDAINALANAEVVRGTEPTATEAKPFSPRDFIKRDQMATFIAQAQDALERGVETDEDFFDDDDENVHEDNINRIASEGITTGLASADRAYGPDRFVNRAQMAAFLSRKIDILVEEGLIENRFDDRAELTVNEEDVDAGDPITGSISGPNIETVTVTGDCVDGGEVTDSGDAEGFQFSIPTTDDAAAGECELTFEVTFTSGRQEEFTATVTINETAAGATDRPELVSAAIVQTTTAAQVQPGRPAGVVASFTFDEDLLDEQGQGTPDAGSFILNAADGDRAFGDEIVSVEGNVVTVRFAANDGDAFTLQTAEDFASITVATVDQDAVRDADEGQFNPEGDAPLGTTSGGGGTVDLPAGITTAPDLVSVSGFRQGSTAGTTAVDFTFDEAAFINDPEGFALVLTNGDVVECVGQPASTAVTGAGSTPSGGTIAGGNGTTTLTVVCENPDDPNTGNPRTAPLTAAEVARGTVDALTVSDAQQMQDNDPAVVTAGNANPLQAVDVSNGGNTADPDLVSVTLTADDNDAATAPSAIFTFDVAVDPNAIDETDFFLFDSEGNETQGTNAVSNQNDRRQVLVTFGDANADLAEAELDTVVGGNVRAGAVTTPVTPTNLTPDANEEDEVGVANTTGGSEGQTAGRTDGPDLTSVTLAEGPADVFGNRRFAATYTFDEDVNEAVVDDTLFKLFLADGTELEATNCAANTTASDTSVNSVTCTAFQVLDNPATTNVNEANGTATSAQIASATLGTVDDGAVADDAGNENPEGAEATTGGTATA